MTDPASPLASAIDSYRVNVASLDSDARRRLIGQFRYGLGRMQNELEALQRAIRTAPRIPIITGTGEVTQGIPPSWIFQEKRYLQLQAEGRAMIQNLSSTMIDGTMTARAGAYTRGISDARSAAASFVPEFDPRAWAGVPRNAVESFLGASSSGPLAALFSSFQTEAGAQAEAFIRNRIASGIQSGRSLLRVAGELQDGLAGISLSRALTITRTETLRAYREGSFRSWKENPKMVRSWVWRAAVDRTDPPPCAACMARHGSEWPISDSHGTVATPMETHPNCRCVMVPQRKDLFDGIRPSGPGSKIEPLGRAAFDRYPLSVQRQILGPTRFGMYQRGEVAFSDFATLRKSQAWGTNRAVVTPIRELEAMHSRLRTTRRIAENRIASDLAAEPGISSVLAELEVTSGGRLAGYNFRVKTFESTARKVASDAAAESITAEEAAAALKDTIRYTYELPEEVYWASSTRIRSELASRGFREIKWKDTWTSAEYKGINSAWINPDGKVFELQFHTPGSLYVKEQISHPLYERLRVLEVGDPEIAKIEAQLREAWAGVREPPM